MKCCGLGRMLRPSRAGFWGGGGGVWLLRQLGARPPSAVPGLRPQQSHQAGKGSTACSLASLLGRPSGNVFPSGDLGVSSSALFRRATESRGRKWWCCSLTPGGHSCCVAFAELAAVLLVPRKWVWGSVTIAGNMVGSSQTGWSHAACHLHYLSGHCT